MKIRNGFVSNSSSSSFVVFPLDSIGTSFIKNFPDFKANPTQHFLRREIAGYLDSSLNILEITLENPLETIDDFTFFIRHLSGLYEKLSEDKFIPLKTELKGVSKKTRDILNTLKNSSIKDLLDIAESVKKDISNIKLMTNEIFGELPSEDATTYSVDNLDYHDWDGSCALITKMGEYGHLKIISEINS